MMNYRGFNITENGTQLNIQVGNEKATFDSMDQLKKWVDDPTESTKFHTEGQLVVWHNCNFGSDTMFQQRVDSVEEALTVLRTLAAYDEYVHTQVYNRPDYCNAQGLTVFTGAATHGFEGEWDEYYDNEGRNIDEIDDDWTYNGHPEHRTQPEEVNA